MDTTNGLNKENGIRKKCTDRSGISGMVFTVTGKLRKWPSRDELFRYLHGYGAQYSVNVSVKTDCFVQGAGSNPQKTAEACRLGIPVIDEEEFNEIIGYRFRDKETAAVPDWVRRLYDGAFEDCPSLKSLFVPDSVAVIDDHAIPPSLRRLEIRTFTPQVNRAMRGRSVEVIVTGSLTELSLRLRPAAVLGFVTEPEKYESPERTAAYNRYISSNAAKLAGFALEHPEFLDYICENRLLSAKDIDAYLALLEGEDRTETRLRLLNCINRVGMDNITEARRRKETTAEKYGEERMERLAARKPEDGIRGMRFAVSGKLHAWSSAGDLEEYLKERGASLDPSVTTKTDYLVTDGRTEPSAKKTRAGELGVPLIEELEFNEIIGYRFRDREDIVIPAWITKADAAVFQNCRSVRSLTLEEGVKEIGNSAFLHRKDLETIVIPESVREIGSQAFSYCSALSGVSIPGGVKNIGESAFSVCGSLAYLNISNGVKSIGGLAFSRCGNLAKVFIPRSVEEIGYAAFSYCDGLRQITCSDMNPSFYAEQNCLIQRLGRQRILVAGCSQSVIPSGVTVIRFGSFHGLKGLLEIEIPDGVERIESNAFTGCSGLIRVTVPESVKKIGQGVFENCSSLREITLPPGITEIRDRCFFNCSALETVTIPESVKIFGINVFGGCGRIRIRTQPGSFAEQYAKENGIPLC